MSTNNNPEIDPRFVPLCIRQASWECIRIDTAKTLYRVPSDSDYYTLYVIGNPENGTYEWCAVAVDPEQIVARSNEGYGSVLVALRNGLNWILG